MSEQDRPAHRLTFQLGDEGMIWLWRVAECPGPEHCKVWVEVDCQCKDCLACAESEHYECEKFADENVTGLGPGCSLKLSETCGLADWLAEIGGEMIEGDVEMAVMAVHTWEGADAPMFRLVGHG